MANEFPSPRKSAGEAYSVLQWSRMAWMESAKRYHTLATFCSQPEVLVALARIIDQKHSEKFSEAIASISQVTGNIPSILRGLIYDEVSKTSTDRTKGSILRGNSLVNRLQASYIKAEAREFLNRLMGSLISELVADPSLSLEVDPAKIRMPLSPKLDSVPLIRPFFTVDEVYPMAGPPSPLQLAPQSSPRDSYLSSALNEIEQSDVATTKLLIENQTHLLEITRVFLERICSTSMVEALPSPIRVMAGLTAEAARKYQPDMIRSLLGGFIMLRVIAPALVSPESYGIASNISPPTRRNLILIAKIMQNTANNIEFGDKEEWMAFANPFIRTYIPVLNGFLDTISSSLPISSLESAPQPFNIQDIDLGDLFVVHDAFWRNRTTLMHALSSNPDCLIPAATLDHFASFLNTLGPSPTHLVGELERIPSSRKDQFNPHRKSSPAASSGEDNLNRPMSSAPLLLMQPPGQDVPHWTEESLAETRFFFNGNATIDGLPSLYLILNRIQPSFFNSVDAVISHLYKVLERLPNSKYVLIVDLSWSVFTDEMKKGLRTYIEQLRTIFSRRYKKNLHKVFLIHPSSTTRGLILLVKAISSIKLDVKFVEIDDWQDLLKAFSPQDILLPESSKSTITKGYHVTKVNSKGKEQKRVIKITLNSLLNIDSSGIVTNEKLLNHIESFSVKLPLALPFQLDIIFCPEGGDALAHVRKTSIHRRLRRTSEQDQFVRRYLLDSPSDLQAIIEEIFHAGFLSGITSILPQEYQVVKVNASGKAQHRIFKLTGDSLLNLNRGCRIRDEISFAGIEMVELDSSDATILWLKKKTEPLPRKIICKDALSLFRVLGEGIERFKAEQPILLRTFQR